MPHSPTPRSDPGHDADDGHPTEDQAPRPSKSQLKRDMTRLQVLGEQFAALPQDRIEAAAVPQALREAVLAFRRTRSHEGRRRQMQYIGKLMRQIDPAPVEEAVLAVQAGHARDTIGLHRAERWRDDLVADDGAITRWLDAHPDTDIQQLRSLVRAARKDAAATPQRRSGRAYRELFQFIRPYLAEVAADERADPHEDSPDA